MLMFLIGCANPIELSFDDSTYCVTDENGGIIKRVTIQKLDAENRVFCERMISQSLDSKGSNTICLFEDNEGYDEYEKCELEKGFIYKVIAQNVGFEDTLSFRIE